MRQRTDDDDDQLAHYTRASSYIKPLDQHLLNFTNV